MNAHNITHSHTSQLQLSTSQKVRLCQLKLASYRNYPHLKLDLTGAHLVLSGHNGAGKTNILEAISLLSPGRGLRRAAYGDIVHVALPPLHSPLSLSRPHSTTAEFSLHATLASEFYGTVEIGTGSIQMAGKDAARRVRINGTAQPLDTMLEYCRIIWLTPAMDGLFTGSASDRRRFVDRLVLTVQPGHGRLVNNYDKAMRARNKLLAQGSQDTSWLKAIEMQMAALGVAIAAARWQLVEDLSALSDQITKWGNFPSAIIELQGFVEQKLFHGLPALDVEEEFSNLLAKTRYSDAQMGRTSIGPHRTDLKIIHRQKAIPAAFASTGEQKALLAGIILAHTKLTVRLSNLTPFLLLDEVSAHLDENRCAALFDQIDEIGAQAFLTGTHRSLFSHLEGKAQFLTLHDNQLAVT